MRNTLPPLASNDLFDGVARIVRAVGKLIANKAKAVDPSVRLLVREFLTLGGYAQAITKTILEEKSASSHASSRTRFEFSVSPTPEQRAIPIRHINIGGGRVRFQRPPASGKKDFPGAWIRESGNCGKLRVSCRMTRFGLTDRNRGRTEHENEREIFH